MTAKSVQVLIVDDSVVYRSQIREALTQMAKFEVVGAPSNGSLAIDYLDRLRVDLVILDLEMSDMNGIEVLKEIQSRRHRCKVVVFSSGSKRGAETAIEAMKLGASDFVPKPGAVEISSQTTGSEPPSVRIRQALEPRLRALFPQHFEDSTSKSHRTHATASFPRISWEKFQPKLVVIGSSTGGPTVLEKIFSELNAPLNCPIVIVQHMPPIFTATLAERLSRVSGIPAFEATDGMTLQANTIYVAPGNYHLRLKGTATRTQLVLDQGPPIHSVRPAVDPLFESASEIFKDSCLGIVLTGMGNDGKIGAQKIKEYGGAVVIQNKESCVVFGMPGAVFEAGAFDREATPSQIVSLLREKVVLSLEGSRWKAGSKVS